LRGLADDYREVSLISRIESLNEVGFDSLSTLKRIWVMDDTAAPESEDIAEDVADGESEDDSLDGLHAKLYVADAGWNSHVFTGSANATHSAFNKNVEFLVELVGKKSKCGVKALFGEGGDDTNKQVDSLADLLVRYESPEDQQDAADTAETAFEKRIEKLAGILAECQPKATCLEVEPSVFELALDASRRLRKRSATDGMSLSIRPASVSESFRTDFNPFATTWCKFERLSCLSLTAFFAVTAKSTELGFERSFLLQAPIENPPEDRREQILRHLLGDKDRVLRFLLMLLSDASARDFTQLLGSNTGEGTKGIHSDLLQATLFESLIRSLDREPAQIEQVESIIRDLRETEEGKDLLPAGLEDIWGPIWHAWQDKHGDS
jgi:hypothetical protein